MALSHARKYRYIATNAATHIYYSIFKDPK